MNYCNLCGSNNIHLQIPNGDNRPRYVCNSCAYIHYQNPNIVAGTLPIWQDKVLLCRRSIEPRSGLWTLPAGFMENGESTLEAAMRETREEANAELIDPTLFALISLPHINQVYLIYHGELVDGRFSAGAETLETQLFTEQDVPWDDMAFAVMRLTLERFFSDRRQGKLHIHDIHYKQELKEP